MDYKIMTDYVGPGQLPDINLIYQLTEDHYNRSKEPNQKAAPLLRYPAMPQETNYISKDYEPL